MKTIIIPTDFSPNSINAAHYAYRLASDLHARVKLLNAIKVASEAPGAAQLVWPAMEYKTLRDDAHHRLSMLADDLNKTADIGSNHYYTSNTATNEIEYDCAVGEVADTLRNEIEASKAVMAIMGMSDSGFWTRVFTGSNRRSVIENACFPVMFVPPDIRYKRFKKIAFATEFSRSDLDVIYSLTSLARHFQSELLLFHVNNNVEDEASRVLAKEFLKEVSNKANYPHIYFREAYGNVEDLLLDLCLTDQIDMVSMVHRKHDRLYRIFSGSHTQHFATITPLPLLVYPEGNNTFF